MCDKDLDRLMRLYESVIKMKPFPEVPDIERAWYNGTLHGVKLAIQQIQEVYRG